MAPLPSLPPTGLAAGWPLPVLGEVAMPTFFVTGLLVFGGLIAVVFLSRALKSEGRGSTGLGIALVFAVACGWMGYLVGEARGDLTALRDSHTALLEGLSRQVDQIGEQLAAAKDAKAGFPRPAPVALAKEPVPASAAAPAAAQAALPMTVDAASQLAEAVAELRRAVDALPGASATVVRGPADGPAPAPDLAALQANVMSRSRDEVLDAHFGWGCSDLMNRYGRPDEVRAEGEYVYWIYRLPLPDGKSTARALFQFLDGSLVGFHKQGLPE